MKNSCWFFGDSFTRGNGCHPDDDYFQLDYNKPKLRWTTKLSSELKLIERNTANGGESNIGIINSLINNLESIKSNDIVIISDTRPVRIHNFNEAGERVNTINDPYFNYKQGNSRYILDYIYHEILPKEEFYLNFYQNMVEKLLKELNRRKVRTYYWKHTDFWYPASKFETITEATNGKTQNLHWSWKGHEDMYKYILDKITNNTSII